MRRPPDVCLRPRRRLRVRGVRTEYRRILLLGRERAIEHQEVGRSGVPTKLIAAAGSRYQTANFVERAALAREKPGAFGADQPTGEWRVLPRYARLYPIEQRWQARDQRCVRNAQDARLAGRLVGMGRHFHHGLGSRVVFRSADVEPFAVGLVGLDQLSCVHERLKQLRHIEWLAGVQMLTDLITREGINAHVDQVIGARFLTDARHPVHFVDLENAKFQLRGKPLDGYGRDRVGAVVLVEHRGHIEVGNQIAVEQQKMARPSDRSPERPGHRCRAGCLPLHK